VSYYWPLFQTRTNAHTHTKSRKAPRVTYTLAEHTDLSQGGTSQLILFFFSAVSLTQIQFPADAAARYPFSSRFRPALRAVIGFGQKWTLVWPRAIQKRDTFPRSDFPPDWRSMATVCPRDHLFRTATDAQAKERKLVSGCQTDRVDIFRLNFQVCVNIVAG